ncbi:MAG: translation elongation factor Ts [Planctomycetota bacterium]|nr:translation elongation factor Ts [Planctomycetota bacterium]
MAVTAAAVKELRDKTGLPMMDCKKALAACDGVQEAAITWLRERGAEVFEKRSGRTTDFGRFGQYLGMDKTACAMVELKCESAPVTTNEDFIKFADDLAQVLAENPDITDTESLLSQAAPDQDGLTLSDVKEEMFNRIREVFNVGRMIRIEGACGGYVHNAGTISGVLISVEGGDEESARDICMHIAAMRPAALSPDELPHEEVEKERQFLRDAAIAEGKPENIVDKMVEGRLRNYFAERTLTEQAFVKDDKQTVGEFAVSKGMTLKQFVRWELGDDTEAGDSEGEAEAE